MTYAQLLDRLQSMSATQLIDDVTVKIDGEYHAISGVYTQSIDDVLHADHCYLKVT